MAVYHTVDGQPYSVTAGTDVTVTDADGLILGVSAGGQGSFVGNGGDVTITGEHHFVQIKGGGGGGGNGGGGGGGGTEYTAGDGIQIDGAVISVDTSGGVVEAGNTLPVGGGTVYNALDSVKFDGNLDDDLHVGLRPAAKSTGSVQLVDTQAAGVLHIGDVATVEIEEMPPYVPPHIDLTPLESYSGTRTLIVLANYTPSALLQWAVSEERSDVSALLDAINGKLSEAVWGRPIPTAPFYVVNAELLDSGKVRVYFDGASFIGNNLKVGVMTNISYKMFEEFTSTSLTAALPLSGGSGSKRTANEIVASINEASAGYVTATYDTAESLVNLEADQAGPNYPMSVEGGMFANPSGMSGGYPKHEILVDSSRLYGRTDIIPPDVSLPEDGVLRHGHIYLITADAETTDLSLLQAEPYAKVDLWLEYVSGSVLWSPNWSWANDLVPENLSPGRYFIELFSDGVVEIAKLNMSYLHA